ncbi:hypothetical protein [Cryobacterium sp. MLB-32]|uniref:hypothetical protein n=1 Tax=Cryobacterium sp. MLB-32 TaxID=1529318 RepID=UPI00068AB0EA|nr:hypothetical protein [Cryobacterium sp. MLB-32]
MPTFVALVLLFTRGFLLWLVIPYGFVAWLVYYWWAKSASLGQCLGWFDINLIALLQLVVLKNFIPTPSVYWVPSKQMSTVNHRIRGYDLL